MMKYNIKGIVTIDVTGRLDPYIIFNYHCFDSPSCNDCCDVCNHKEKKWDNFDIDKYKKIVIDRALIEVHYILQDLPDYLTCSYVEDSAYVNSENGEDVLCFQVESEHEHGEERLQKLLEVYLMTGCLGDGDCSNCYNDSSCRMYEYIEYNHSLDCFQFDKSEGGELKC